ncbi:hypothetical protein P872_16435 [Rhodonellum psychrophilum GCM71 = DSM 17998]|uniref:Dihydrofolate synthase/folylpolyglutamate synthase n=2 Tax=Rhodonellum TaxID=336827 RepID=U5BRQ3_9BACT|nr:MULTISPECIES: folylpolyglutamate synthase/dihydrofolate synthase family protein [Rhodonellum]ERM83265.1 hypothetical protein P872_16435 [Rhodonellum psychrophilum GCM71 = DSM 17998]SDZ50502.1 dihydrofolate synthase / folylpolyglutamate synthase [Rhodonellum ikkaensis]
MDYPQTLDYLFNALPMFQRIGGAAFKKDLSNTLALCDLLGNPQNQFKSIHIAGTNGKGSSSHAIASILQEAGFKVGLYTSPHLKSFTERIKINGNEIPEEEVVEFVAKNKQFFEEKQPSFFEMTVGMAFWHFAKEKVDYAVVEVGMGGKFDSTNIIHPILCLITNIGYDHMQFLGNTLPEIAGEKAGIIKENVPVVISQRQEETSLVFIEKAKAMNAPLYFSEYFYYVEKQKDSPIHINSLFKVLKDGKPDFLEMDLHGNYQAKNLAGILKATDVLQNMGISIEEIHVKNGLRNIVKNTGLKGRWQTIQEHPRVICDTGHNEDGIKYIVEQIAEVPYDHLFMVIGMVNDKDVSKVLSLLPKKAEYFFCQAKIPRAMQADVLYEHATKQGLIGKVVNDVNEAIGIAKARANKNDLIFIGGSTFVVAEVNDL